MIFVYSGTLLLKVWVFRVMQYFWDPLFVGFAAYLGDPRVTERLGRLLVNCCHVFFRNGDMHVHTYIHCEARRMDGWQTVPGCVLVFQV